jgi:hypothetical protein
MFQIQQYENFDRSIDYRVTLFLKLIEKTRTKSLFSPETPRSISHEAE